MWISYQFCCGRWELVAYFLCLDVLNVGCYPLDTHADNINL
nr:MAG TPA: hypothetical protein [Caudoviricetes sp.]